MIAYGLTDVGKTRNMNQDFIFASEEPIGPLSNLLVVADGMGGHNAGELASSYAVECMLQAVRESSKELPIAVLGDAIRLANQKVLDKGAADPALKGMGTTLVAATVQGEYIYIANVGDSRLYLIGKAIEQVTRDHSLVEEMVRIGELKREEARSHPNRNVITRAIGVRSELKIDFFDCKLEKKDCILLCSDGLTNMVEDAVISRIVRQNASLQEAAQKLIREANRNGGKDNISVVLARADKGGW